MPCRWPASAAFISADTKGTTVYEGKSASGYVTGDLFNMPAGAVKAVFGAEWREESIDDQPDEAAIAGNIWGSSSAIVTKGEDSVKELFTEFEVPLLNDKRFAEDLYLSGSLRWTDYDSYGDDTTYKVGLNYLGYTAGSASLDLWHLVPCSRPVRTVPWRQHGLQ